MGRVHKVLLATTFFHLIIVAMGASQFDFYRLGVVGSWLHVYGQVTGAGSGYGFFAPGVGDGLRAEFDIHEGISTRTVKLEPGHNRESDLRIGNLLNALSKHLDDEKTRRSVSASLAAKMFNQFPNASGVTVRLESIGIATMSEYRAGKTSSDWKSLYKAKFVRSSKKTI